METKINGDVTRIQFDTAKEWLAHRDKIGGSDAAAILGLSPYKTNQELWREKTGRKQPEDISDKPHVIYGQAAEEHIRALFALDYPQYQVEYYGNNMVFNKRFPWAHASLDGELTDQDGRKGVLEIKTSEVASGMQYDRWKGKIPDNYYCQVLHYLMVTGYDFAVLTAQLKHDFDGELVKRTRHYFIKRQEVKDDMEYLIEKEKEFWQAMKEGWEPSLILPGF